MARVTEARTFVFYFPVMKLSLHGRRGLATTEGSAARPSPAVTVSTDEETELREAKSWTEVIQQKETGIGSLTQGL